jgi:tetratricopeptide (TPR) repeat protein
VLLLAAAPSALARNDDPDGAKMLAENYAQLAQLTLATRAITPETLDQAIALLKGARKLNPDEARFARLLAEAALQAGKVDDAIEAYDAIYRRIDPSDIVAQIRLMDLHVGKMQTADARLSYLKTIMEAAGIASEVRSHAAYLISKILLDRAQPQEALERLEESLRLFPLSPEALKLKYDLVGDAGTPRDRVALLLDMLRSNPAQPGVMAQLASELADIGMTDQAMNWYGSAISIVQRIGRGITPEDLDRFASLLLIAGQVGPAQQWTERLLKTDAKDVDAAFLALIIARRAGDAELLEKARTEADQALLGRASTIRQQLEGAPVDASATQPAAGAEVNVPEDVKKLLEVGDVQLTAAYASTLADLAWKYIYFDDKPANAEPVITSLRQLLPPDSITLTRLDGWSYLTSGRPREARVKLSAVADRDPLAQLGLIRLMEQDPAEKPAAIEAARQLMDQNPSGLLGAIIHDALRDMKRKLPPGQQPALSAEAEEVKAVLDAFPRKWLEFLDKPQDFYQLRGETLKVSHEFGEPIIARITFSNIGPYDITIGPDAAIRPDVWIDASIRGIVQQMYPGVAYDRLTQRVVLKPRQQFSQNVRVDQGQLLSTLHNSATVSVPIFLSVFDNPIMTPGGPAPAPGGQRQPFMKVVNRQGVRFQPESIGKALKDLAQGAGDLQMRSINLLLWFVVGIQQIQDPNQRAMAGDILAAVRKAGNDPNPHLRSWANFMLLGILDQASRKRIVEEMLSDEVWSARLLGLSSIMQRFEPAEWKALAGPLASSDPDPIVRDFAVAIVAFADNPAATQPSTQPSEEQPGAPLAQP